MDKLCLIVEDTFEFRTILDRIVRTFICFVDVRNSNLNNYIEVTIEARLEDMASIERRISAFV